ncbi:MAG: hypothetical protein ACOCTT_01320 [archaeon]
MQSQKKCPNCGAEDGITFKIDMEKARQKFSSTNPLKLRKVIKKAMNNPVKSDWIELEPCKECGAVHEDKIEEDDENGDK